MEFFLLKTKDESEFSPVIIDGDSNLYIRLWAEIGTEVITNNDKTKIFKREDGSFGFGNIIEEGSADVGNTDDPINNQVVDGEWVGKSESDLLLEKKEKTQLLLIDLCDSKQESVEKLILGYKATPKQIQRYLDKYERALSGEFDADTNQAIITKFEAARSAIRAFVDMIEMFRERVADLIEHGELDKADSLIKIAEKFGSDTTISDVESLLNG